MHYLIDLDNTLLDTFYQDKNGDFQFYWLDSFEKDYGLSRKIFSDLFNSEFLTALQKTTELYDFIDPFIKKHNLSLSNEELIEYWLSRDANINLKVFEWIKNKKSQGHILHIASNQPHIRMEYLWNKFPEWHSLFDKVFTSAQIGIAKPETGFFKYAKNELDIPYSEICLVDDCPKNIATAKDLGIKTIFFTSFDDLIDK